MDLERALPCRFTSPGCFLCFVRSRWTQGSPPGVLRHLLGDTSGGVAKGRAKGCRPAVRAWRPNSTVGLAAHVPILVLALQSPCHNFGYKRLCVRCTLRFPATVGTSVNPTQLSRQQLYHPSSHPSTHYISALVGTSKQPLYPSLLSQSSIMTTPKNGEATTAQPVEQNAPQADQDDQTRYPSSGFSHSQFMARVAKSKAKVEAMSLEERCGEDISN